MSYQPSAEVRKYPNTSYGLGVEVLNNFFAEYATFQQKLSGCIVDWQNHSANGKAIIDVGSEKNLIFWEARKDSSVLFSHSSQIKEFIARIQEIHYIDGHRYPTHPTVCKSIAEMTQIGCKVFIHLTPRQKHSEDQKFIPLELSAFHNSVEQQGGFLREKTYLQGSPKTLDTHFRILKEFKPS